MTPCAVCGASFIAPINNPDKMYCTRKCNLKAWKARNPDQHKQNSRDYWDKNKEYIGERSKERYAAMRASMPAPCPKPLRIAPCPRAPRLCGCGSALLASRQRLCQACVSSNLTEQRIQQRLTPASRAAKARYKAQRRAKLKIDAESFDPIEVFDRDRWICQLCGIKTPKSHRGKNLPTSPELDHIISLKHGGAHTRANTQCACRTCNGEKGSNSKGQLGLHFGVST